MSCPVCLKSCYTVLLTRDAVPVLQNVIVPTIDQARRFPVGRLRICQCQHCSFVWNADFDPQAIVYDSHYNNSVQSSDVYQLHQAAMAARILARPGDLAYLEIGCGEGEFLRLLSRSGRLRKAVAFDPAYKGPSPVGEAIRIFKEYFGEDTAHTLPDDIDLVCSRHTIEHIPDPRRFIAPIADYIHRRKLPLLLETPDVSWILKSKAFEDFFYEHCSLFSPRSMRYLLAEFGLQCRVDIVYGGQYMWIEAGPADQELPVETPMATSDHPSAAMIAELEYWHGKIQALNAEGAVALWGAASKGVTFSLLIDGFDCAIDLNRSKQGCFMPVSGVPIVSPETALERGVRSIIVMNPQYQQEIRGKLNAMGWRGNLLVLHDPVSSEPNSYAVAS